MDYSKQQFEQLFKDNYPRMYRLAYAMVEEAEDARDVVSQVFAQMWQKQPVVAEGAVVSYLLQATHNQALYVLRQRERRRTVEEELRQQRPDRESPQHKELISELHRVIETQLTEQDRRVLQLHFDQEMTYGEAAQQLGISISAVNKHITQSLHKLRKAFRR